MGKSKCKPLHVQGRSRADLYDLDRWDKELSRSLARTEARARKKRASKRTSSKKSAALKRASNRLYAQRYKARDSAKRLTLTRSHRIVDLRTGDVYVPKQEKMVATKLIGSGLDVIKAILSPQPSTLRYHAKEE